MRDFLILFVISIGLLACKKDAGEGGTSVIEGQVYKVYTYASPITGEDTTMYYYLDPGKDVFIIYSNNESAAYDDKFETDWEGKYRFEYLRKGDYTLYTYADSTVEYSDELSVTYDYPVFKHIMIESNNSTNKVDDFVIEEN